MFSELLKTHPMFDNKLSRKFRESMVPTFQGLGLPTFQYCNRCPWGYVKQGDIYMPVEQDLQILLKAVEMADSKQYHTDDVVLWVQSAPISTTFEKRQFFNIKRDRPPFSELRLPIEERIQLVHRTTSRTPKESIA